MKVDNVVFAKVSHSIKQLSKGGVGLIAVVCATAVIAGPMYTWDSSSSDSASGSIEFSPNVDTEGKSDVLAFDFKYDSYSIEDSEFNFGETIQAPLGLCWPTCAGHGAKKTAAKKKAAKKAALNPDAEYAYTVNFFTLPSSLKKVPAKTGTAPVYKWSWEIWADLVPVSDNGGIETKTYIYSDHVRIATGAGQWVTEVPEPGSIVLLLAGLSLMSYARRRYNGLK